MLKLYKNMVGRIHYHEAWANGETICEHWGVVGERGQYREHALAANQSAEDTIKVLLASAWSDGYLPLAPGDYRTLLIEYSIRGNGSSKEIAKRHRLEERMNETLGWTGLGECGGGSIGSGSMEVSCSVVDSDIAMKVIEADLANTEFADYSRIYLEEAE